MAKSESILSGILKYSISTWINVFIGFASVVITTRLLSPETYGQITLFISAVSVLMYTLSFGLDGAFIRFFNEPPQNNTVSQLLYKNLVIITVVSLGIGGLATFLFGDYLSSFLFNVYGKFLLGLMFVQTWSQIVLRFLNITYRMSFQVKKYTIQNILLNCATRLAIIIGAIIDNDFYFITILCTLCIALTTIIYITIQQRDIKPFNKDNKLDFSLRLDNFKPYFKYALFSAPTYIVANINSYSSNQIVVSVLGAHALGIFASTGMFGQILMVIKGGFGTFWSAFVYKNYNNEQDKIVKVHDFVMLISIIAVSLLVLFRDVIYLFIGEQFHESKSFFSLLLVYPIMTFILETTGKGVEIAKKNHITLIAHVSAVVVNILGCYILSNIWGVVGAAAANALSSLLIFTIITYFAQKYYKSIDSLKKSILGFCSLITICIIPVFFNNLAIMIGLVLLMNWVTYLIYKNETKIVLEIIKNKIKCLK